MVNEAIIGTPSLVCLWLADNISQPTDVRKTTIPSNVLTLVIDPMLNVLYFFLRSYRPAYCFLLILPCHHDAATDSFPFSTTISYFP